MATEYNSQKIIGIITLFIVLIIFKVNVPVTFSGTEGFPARRDGRYIESNLHPIHTIPACEAARSSGYFSLSPKIVL